MSPDVFCLDGLHDTLLIGPRSTFQRVASAVAASESDVRRRLIRQREQTGTLGALRDCCRGWGVPVSRPSDLTLHLVDRVAEAVARKSLVAYVLPPVLEAAAFGADLQKARDAIRLAGPAGAKPNAGPEPARRLPPPTLEQRIVDIVRRAEKHLPAGRYAQVFEPIPFVKGVAVLALWIDAPLGVTTPIMAAVFRAATGLTDSQRIGDRTADIEAVLDQVSAARDDMAFDQAARGLARLIARFGADDFIRIMQVVPEKIRGGGPVKEVYVYPPMRTIVPRVPQGLAREAPVPFTNIVSTANFSIISQINPLLEKTSIDLDNSVDAKLNMNSVINSVKNLYNYSKEKVFGVEPLSENELSQIRQAKADAQSMLEKTKDNLQNCDNLTKAQAILWFGDDSEYTRANMLARVKKEIDKLKMLGDNNFLRASGEGRDAYAYVYPNDDSKIYIGASFWSANMTGTDSKAGTLIHEISHFNSISGTEDHAYSELDCQRLAVLFPEQAQNNADSFEYFVEQNSSNQNFHAPSSHIP